MDIGEIYCATSPSGKKYIGQVVKIRPNGRRWGYLERWKNHVREAFSDNLIKSGCSALNRAIKKYGASNFKLIVLEECKIEDLDERETYYIEFYQTFGEKGYNLTSGGQGTKRMAESSKDKLASVARKPISNETREKMRQSHLGKKHSEESKEKMKIAGKKPKKIHNLPKYICFIECSRGFHGYQVRFPQPDNKEIRKIFRSDENISLGTSLENAKKYLLKLQNENGSTTK
jgi:group I intron endonuclease